MTEATVADPTLQSRGIHYAWWILVACCLLQAINIGMINNTAPLFVAVVPKDMGVATGSFSLWISIKQFLVVVASPIAAKIFSKYGMKWPLAIGIVVNAALTASLYLATGLVHFYVVGIIAGFAAGFIHLVPTAILVARWFHKKLGFAMGVALAFSAVGGFVFNPLIGHFITAYGWRTAYLLIAIINIVVILPVALFIVKDKPADKGLQPYGYGAPAAEGPAVVHTLTPAGGGVTKAAAYRNPAFYCLLTFIFLWSCYGGLAMYLSPYLFGLFGGHENAKSAMAIAAQFAAILSIVAGVGKVLLGMVNDRFGATAVIVPAGIIMAATPVLLLATGPNVLLVYIIGAVMAVGMAAITLQPPVVTARIFGKKNYAEIYGWVVMMAVLGSAICVTLVGYAYDYFKSYAIPFYVLCALVLVGVVFYFIALGAAKRLVWEKE